jgi:hypothetical protein
MELADFLAKYIKQVIADPTRHVVTAEEFNNILNLLITQGDYNSEAVTAAIDRLLELNTAIISNNIKAIRLNVDNVIETTSDGVNWYASGSSGHAIYNAAGVLQPQRNRLKFLNTTVTDNGTETVISGLQGIQGVKGDTGATGAQGIQGIQGPLGHSIIPSVDQTSGIMTFTEGPAGVIPSAVMVRGPQGVQGVQGVQGPIGVQGIQGVQGPGGPQGLRGDDGADGRSFVVKALYPTLYALQTAHPTGVEGDAYAVGASTDNTIMIWDVAQSAWIEIGPIQGPQGAQGIQGIQGIQGPQGIQGTQGVQGASAYSGALSAGYVGTEAQFNTDLTDISNKVSKTGSTMTGNLTVSKDVPSINLTSPKGTLNVYKNATSTVDAGSRFTDNAADGSYAYLSLCRENGKSGTANLISVSNNGTSYRLYGEHNKPTATDVGALPSVGGAISGDLSISNIDPWVSLQVPAKGSSLLRKAVDATNDYGTILSDYATDGSVARLQLCREASKTGTRNGIIYDINGTQYAFYGEHNKPTAADLGIGNITDTLVDITTASAAAQIDIAVPSLSAYREVIIVGSGVFVATADQCWLGFNNVKTNAYVKRTYNGTTATPQSSLAMVAYYDTVASGYPGGNFYIRLMFPEAGFMSWEGYYSYASGSPGLDSSWGYIDPTTGISRSTISSINIYSTTAKLISAGIKLKVYGVKK